MRLIALDVDNTLATVNSPAKASTVALMRALEAQECRFILLSGKPAAYVAGLARQLGATRPLVAGENGAVIMSSPDFPPDWEHIVEIGVDARRALADFAADVSRDFGDSVWLQPNRLNVSVFWRELGARAGVISAVENFLAANRTQQPGFVAFVHDDCAEILAPGADKGSALLHVTRILRLDPADVVAIGDSANDVSMFEVAGHSIGIRIDGADRRFEDIDAALAWLLGAAQPGQEEERLAEYSEVSADWRHRDGMLWQSLAVSLTITGLAVGAAVSWMPGQWLAKAALCFLAFLLNSLVLLKIVKDNYYQHGSSELLRCLEGGLQCGLRRSDDGCLRIHEPDLSVENRRLRLVHPRWLYRWLAGRSTFQWFFAVQILLVLSALGGTIFCLIEAC